MIQTYLEEVSGNATAAIGTAAEAVTAQKRLEHVLL